MPGRLLALKILLAPALVGLASWTSRRWGPVVGGWCAALPLTSGPVILILALERGPGFAAHAALGILQALVSLTAFAIAYAWSARYWPWGRSTVIGCAAYLACTWALYPVALPIWLAFPMSCLALFAGIRAIPPGGATREALSTPPWDIPLRMVVSAVLVASLTTGAALLGSRMSGLLTPFPVVATVLAASTHRLEGAGAVTQLLRGLLVGLYTFAVFFLVVAEAMVPWGVAAAFVAATLGALAYQAVAWAVAERLGSSGSDRSGVAND